MNHGKLHMNHGKSQRVKQGMLPLRNVPEKRNLFFNTMVCSSKELGTRISENVWPFP